MQLTTLCINGGPVRSPPSELLHLNQAGVQHFICDLRDAHASAFRDFHKFALYFWMYCCREDRTLLEVVTPMDTDIVSTQSWII